MPDSNIVKNSVINTDTILRAVTTPNEQIQDKLTEVKNPFYDQDQVIQSFISDFKKQSHDSIEYPRIINDETEINNILLHSTPFEASGSSDTNYNIDNGSQIIILIKNLKEIKVLLEVEEKNGEKFYKILFDLDVNYVNKNNKNQIKDEIAKSVETLFQEISKQVQISDININNIQKNLIKQLVTAETGILNMIDKIVASNESKKNTSNIQNNIQTPLQKKQSFFEKITNQQNQTKQSEPLFKEHQKDNLEREQNKSFDKNVNFVKKLSKENNNINLKNITLNTKPEQHKILEKKKGGLLNQITKLKKYITPEPEYQLLNQKQPLNKTILQSDSDSNKIQSDLSTNVKFTIEINLSETSKNQGLTSNISYYKQNDGITQNSHSAQESKKDKNINNNEVENKFEDKNQIQTKQDEVKQQKENIKNNVKQSYNIK